MKIQSLFAKKATFFYFLTVFPFLAGCSGSSVLEVEPVTIQKTFKTNYSLEGTAFKTLEGSSSILYKVMDGSKQIGFMLPNKICKVSPKDTERGISRELFHGFEDISTEKTKWLDNKGEKVAVTKTKATLEGDRLDIYAVSLKNQDCIIEASLWSNEEWLINQPSDELFLFIANSIKQ